MFRKRSIFLGFFALLVLSLFVDFTSLNSLNKVLLKILRKKLIKCEYFFGQGSINEDKGLPDESLEVDCHIPKLDPYDASILKYLEDPMPVSVKCSEKYPPFFFTDMESNLVFNESYKHEVKPNTDCCYKEILRVNADNFKFSSECHQIEKLSTKIPNTIDSIAVYCFNAIVDMFGFIHAKEPAVGHNFEKEGVNVVVLGTDSISHMNFIRTMPKTRSFLKKNLSAISMNGLTKVGINTYPILYPTLMGLSSEEILNCLHNKTFDSCPFIWKLYSAFGYKTVYFEDGFLVLKGTIFNSAYENGFDLPPTDYYPQPLFNAQDTLLGQFNTSEYHRACYGPRLAIEYVLDMYRKAAFTFSKNNQKYFQVGWTSILGHDHLNLPKLGDEPVFELLKWLHSGNYLNKTVFILMSDHGLRFGSMRAQTYQGTLEDNMPYMYTVIPQWLSEKYKLAVNNFRSNSQKLVTHYDIQETLIDLASLYNIEDEENINRKKDLETFNFSTPTNKYRGISLFLPIPKSRTCKEASIPNQFCVCHTLYNVNIKNQKEVTLLGKAVVLAINKMLSNYSHLCAKLSLFKVTRMERSVPENQDLQMQLQRKHKNEGYYSAIVNIITSPANASFEAKVSKGFKGTWTVDDLMTISRTNKYGNQSHCIPPNEARILKSFCYCK